MTEPAATPTAPTKAERLVPLPLIVEARNCIRDFALLLVCGGDKEEMLERYHGLGSRLDTALRQAGARLK